MGFQHNPYVNGGMDAPPDSIAAVQKEQSEDFGEANIRLRHIAEQGDTVAVHTQILFSKSNPAEEELRQVHIFRFDTDDRIIEYLDITQVIRKDTPYAANAFQGRIG